MKTILKILIVMILVALSIWCLYIDRFLKEYEQIFNNENTEIVKGSD